jgi:hypothetical protein
MKTLSELLEFTYEQKKKRNWNHIYWAIDLHDTVITGKYNKFNEGSIIYPYAKEVLDFLYQSNVHRTILWTSSFDDSVSNILGRFDLNFHYFNENPECPNTDICNFSEKFYFNILLDDKSGFDGNDWKTIREFLITSELTI